METSRLEPALLRDMHQDELRAYAELSGDSNLIHLNRAQATLAGHPDVICHGMLSMTDIGSWLTRAMTGWQLEAFSCRFVAPMSVGTRLSIAEVCPEEDEMNSCEITINFSAKDNKSGDVKVIGRAYFRWPGASSSR